MKEMYTELEQIIGKTITYKKLCEVLRLDKPKTGNSKILHLKDIQRFYDLNTDKKITVIRKLSEEECKEKPRRSTLITDNPQYIIDRKFDCSSGIYCIATNNEIYIGNTINMRKRFEVHRSSDNQPHTRKLLELGGIFQALLITDLEDRELLEDIEQIYIDYFIELGEFEVINKRKAIADNEPTNRIIRVSNDNYDKAIKLLEENGLI